MMLKKVLSVAGFLMVIAAAQAENIKISGFVSASPKGDSFVIGTSKGKFAVDAKKAKSSMKNGLKIDINKLSVGSQIIVEGDLDDSDKIIASSVVCLSQRGHSAVKSEEMDDIKSKNSRTVSGTAAQRFVLVEKDDYSEDKPKKSVPMSAKEAAMNSPFLKAGRSSKNVDRSEPISRNETKSSSSRSSSKTTSKTSSSKKTSKNESKDKNPGF